MRRYLAALIIILGSVNLALGFNPSDVEWASAVSGTLSKGGTLTSGQYMVKAIQFTSPVPGVKDRNGNIIPETDVDPMVFLEVYKNGTLIKQLVMTTQSEAYIDPDYEAMISATGFPAKNAKEWVLEYYNPWATVSIQLRAKPKLEVTVSADKSAYTSYNDLTITAKVTVTNSGEAVLKNVYVNLGIGELQLRGGDPSQLHQYYYKMEKGTSQSFEVILEVPLLIDQKSYTLSADANGIDVKDIAYNAVKSSTSITVSPKQNYFTISKAVSKDRMYLQDTAIVKLTVANGGMYDISNISVNDSMNEKFKLLSNASFQWNIPLLKPGDEWGTSYSIKPLETNINGFTIPAASAQFTVNNKPYSVSTKSTNVVVNGPKLVLNKTVNRTVVNITEGVIVTVNIKNVGNIATRVEVKDILPDGVSLVNGSTSLATTFLDLNTPQVFSYTIRMNKEGEIELPAAVANYTGVEYKGLIRSVLSSEKPVITVIDPSKVPPITNISPAQAKAATQTPSRETASSPANTSQPTPTLIASGFEVVLAIIVLIFAAVCRRG